MTLGIGSRYSSQGIRLLPANPLQCQILALRQRQGLRLRKGRKVEYPWGKLLRLALRRLALPWVTLRLLLRRWSRVPCRKRPILPLVLQAHLQTHLQRKGQITAVTLERQTLATRQEERGQDQGQSLEETLLGTLAVRVAIQVEGAARVGRAVQAMAVTAAVAMAGAALETEAVMEAGKMVESRAP